MDDAVRAHDHPGVDVGRGRVLDGDPGKHESVDGPAPEYGFGSRQLAAVVDPQDLVGVGRDHRLDRTRQERDDIGEVVLPLGVRRAEAVKGRPELCSVEHVDPCVALHRHRFAGGQIALLDDAHYMTGSIAHDSPMPDGSAGIPTRSVQARALDACAASSR